MLPCMAAALALPWLRNAPGPLTPLFTCHHAVRCKGVQQWSARPTTAAAAAAPAAAMHDARLDHVPSRRRLPPRPTLQAVKAMDDGMLTSSYYITSHFSVDFGTPSSTYCSMWDAASQQLVNDTARGPISE